jgi:hypothetical protein
MLPLVSFQESELKANPAPVSQFVPVVYPRGSAADTLAGMTSGGDPQDLNPLRYVLV